MHLTPHADELIFDAYRLGVRTIDTAPNYARFNSHELLGSVLARLGISSDVVVHTKVGYRLDDTGARVVHDISASHIRASVPRFAAELGAPPTVLLHNPEALVESGANLDEAGRSLAAGCEVLAPPTRGGGRCTCRRASSSV